MELHAVVARRLEEGLVITALVVIMVAFVGVFEQLILALVEVLGLVSNVVTLAVIALLFRCHDRDRGELVSQL